jgi:hypothetical protein
MDSGQWTANTREFVTVFECADQSQSQFEIDFEFEFESEFEFQCEREYKHSEEFGKISRQN